MRFELNKKIIIYLFLKLRKQEINGKEKKMEYFLLFGKKLGKLDQFCI